MGSAGKTPYLIRPAFACGFCQGGVRYIVMIGTKKLTTIRKEIKKALGDDPIGELERQIAAAKRKGEGTEIIAGLKRFLESSPKPRRHKRGANARK
jgi:hypothetical protein